jgi:hypothetical protein
MLAFYLVGWCVFLSRRKCFFFKMH